MKKSTLTLLAIAALFLAGEPAGAQNVSEPASDFVPYYHLPVIGTPTPTAASLGVYSNFPVGNFTGVPDISVPIYEINEGSYKLPISLSYNASGVKVNDQAGWTGLGWSLNAGGVITRNIMGYPDDENDASWAIPEGGVPYPIGGNGWLYYNYNNSASYITTQWQNNANFVPFFNTGVTNTNYQAASMASLRWYSVDCDPDIFCFNFNGHTGKFVFNQGTDPSTNIGTVAANAHQALLIPYQDLKVSYAFAGQPITLPGNSSETYSGSASWLASFTITDEQGNSYVFSEPEYILSDTYYANFLNPAAPTGNSDVLSGGFMSWYLTKITTVQGRVINFTYANESYTVYRPKVYSWRAFNLTNYPIANSTTETYDYISAVRLKTIEGDDFKVYMDASQSRADLLGDSALTAIRIYSKDASGNQTFVKEFDLGYSYLQSFINPNYPNDASVGDPNQRLMLQTVREKGTDGVTTKPAYQFAYNHDIPLPNRYAFAQDFWGYFNNDTATNILMPTIYVYPSGTTHANKYSVFPIPGATGFTFPGIDRTCNPAAVISGTLNQITYPTGGTTSFTFEPNQFYYEGQNITGGGLRLKQSVHYDGINHANDIIKKYSYMQSANPSVSSGVLFNMPVFAYSENFLGYWESNYYTLSLVAQPSTIDYYNHYMVVGSAPNGSMSGFDGINVGYSEIIDSTNGNGWTHRTFGTPGRYGDVDDLSGGSYCSTAADGYCDNLFAATPTAYDFNYVYDYCQGSTFSADPATYPDLTGMDFGPYTYPLPPNTNYEWNRGLLLSETVYNQNGTPVKETDNSYSPYSLGAGSAKFVYGLRRAAATNYHMYLATCTNVFGLATYDVYGRYGIITNVSKVPSSTVVKTFDQNTPTSFTQSVANYTYSLTCKNPSTVSTNASNGETIVDHRTYATDYGPSTGSTDPHVEGLVNLQNTHVVGPVVERYFERKAANGTSEGIFDGLVTTFKPTVPLPDQIYQLQAAAPVTSYNTASFGTVMTIDPNYADFASIDAYDAVDNTLEQHKVGDKYDSYIWDYVNQYPIAKVSNAVPGDIAYTSFEADGTGGWAFSNTAIVADATAPTGGKAFDLTTDLKVTKTGLNSATTYVVSYWSKGAPASVGGTSYVTKGVSINGWTYYEHRISGVTTFEIGGTTLIDELRLYPVGALMTTYAYTPMVGTTAQCGPDNRITYYEYDVLNRLLDVRDQYKNITKQYTYQYNTPPLITVGSYNLLTKSGYGVIFTNLSSGIQYSYSIPYDNVNWHSLGNIPAGLYNITITQPSGANGAVGMANPCNSIISYSNTTSVFFNVSIGTGGCNNVLIQNND